MLSKLDDDIMNQRILYNNTSFIKQFLAYHDRYNQVSFIFKRKKNAKIDKKTNMNN